MSDQPNNVVEVACPCPGTPHTTDTITLYPTDAIPLALGIAALAAVRRAAGNGAAAEAGMAEAYLRFGIQSWTLVGHPDARGIRLPIPVTPETIAYYLRWPTGLEVAEAADLLYGEEVSRPLAQRSARLLPTTPTEPSIPPTSDTGSPPPTPSEPSSPNGTAGEASEVLAP